ncbi:adenine deaminase [Xanthovirga aplysinae]|uniref:adenine deaminase n=1 Tax=Xanthovirga aplysinae TaxID=2529853 RepID=UPI0012BC00E7|nr:adenine deaminase [Xanthovirga aplysinae]MTI30443.1 adenine deaminase [Xanthovirga aplysinae]
MKTNQISGNIVDIRSRSIYQGIIHIENGMIKKIEPSDEVDSQYILPGFVDSHVHIESSMLVPSEFARLAVPHGTVATVSDPHEIGNVLGIEGVKYMMDNGKQVNFKFYFGAPSCVPATSFETAGASISAEDIAALFQYPEVKYLAEMMNWPGVLNKDPEVYEKLAIAKKFQRPIDGHAPGLKGEKAQQYASAGITTDHECFTREEALDKLKYGMHILIREGSAAKNFEALIDLLPDYSPNIMFCSDDKHPDNLVEGHINLLVKRALSKGYDLFDVLQAACLNPVQHYKLEVGLLQEGDPADFIVINNPEDFDILGTYINGEQVAKDGKTLIKPTPNKTINNFNTSPKTPTDFRVEANGEKIRVIEALDGLLVTNELQKLAKKENGFTISDSDGDILKIAVVNRYQDRKPAVSFIKNFGFKEGAIAGSVAHDSHNIIAVGVDDASICKAVNMVIKEKGGVSAVNGEEEMIIPLPVAGLMSPIDGYQIAEQYADIDRLAKKMGSKLQSPFMTLSFMALLVIPSAKLSDLGLFDGDNFKFTSLFIS